VAGIAYTELGHEPWRAVVSTQHPLARAGRIRIAELAGDPFATIGASRLADVCRAAGVEPLPGPSVRNLEDALVVIAASRAWTLLGEQTAGGPGVVGLELADELDPLRLWLAHRADPAPAVARLLACVPESPPC
jgi:DNA-binding transcriptional LysR family regulator